MNVTAKRNLVLQAIERNPEASNDDAILLSEVWSQELAEQGINISSGYLHNILKRVSRPSTLERRRREVFNAGLIQYSDKALKRRSEAFKSEVYQHSNFTERILGI